MNPEISKALIGYRAPFGLRHIDKRGNSVSLIVSAHQPPSVCILSIFNFEIHYRI